MRTATLFLAALVVSAICCSASLLQADEHVYAYPVPLKAADRLCDGPVGKPLPFKEGTTFVWIDLMPEAKFAHPTLYVLLIDREAKVVKGQWWPELNGERVLSGKTAPLLVRSTPKATAGKRTAAAVKQSGQARQVAPDAGKILPCEKPQGNVIRPEKVDAKVKGCFVSKPGRYEAEPGDLIELEYTYPVVPVAWPKSVHRETDRGAIYPSQLGIRRLVVPDLIGTGTYVFYFEAKHAGKGTAFVVIDNVKYEYVFDVKKNRK
mgnify:CR=1 FL=1